MTNIAIDSVSGIETATNRPSGVMSRPAIAAGVPMVPDGCPDRLPSSATCSAVRHAGSR